MGEAESERSRAEAEANDLSGGAQENSGGAEGTLGEAEERRVIKETAGAVERSRATIGNCPEYTKLTIMRGSNQP
jgi:hypothetical protein